MKQIIFLVLITFSIGLNGQEVKKDCKIYQVKKERIFLEGKDVTEVLNNEESRSILDTAKSITKSSEKEEKALKKRQKVAKKQEKAQKKAEKAEK